MCFIRDFPYFILTLLDPEEPSADLRPSLTHLDTVCILIWISWICDLHRSLLPIAPLPPPAGAINSKNKIISTMDGEPDERKRQIICMIATLILSYHAENELLFLELLQMQQDILTAISTNTNNTLMSTARVTIQGYVSNMVPRFGDQQFRQNFRLTRTAYDFLESIIARHIHHHQNPRAGRPSTWIRKQLLATIWLLGTPESYRSISERFDMAKSVLYTSALQIVKILCNNADRFIRWPTEAEQSQIKRSFLPGLPGVIGAVDGTFIYCSEPKENSNAYNTRKCQHAIQLQAICTKYLKFINIFTGYPGSVGDYRVFRNSDIYKDIERNPGQFFPQDGHILGDKAYPLKTWCITPFKDNGRLTPAQRHFNSVHSSARSEIEHSFALLKGRFRRLKHLEIIRHDLAPYYILAACVLHNICLNLGGENIEEYLDEGTDRDVNNDVIDRGHDPFAQEAAPIAAINKRDYLCNLMSP